MPFRGLARENTGWDMGPMLGPIDYLLVYLEQSFVSLIKTIPSPTACDLLGCEADHLSTLSSLLIIVLEMSWVLHKL